MRNEKPKREDNLSWKQATHNKNIEYLSGSKRNPALEDGMELEKYTHKMDKKMERN